MTYIDWILIALLMVCAMICIGVASVAAEMNTRLKYFPPWALAFSAELQLIRDEIMGAVQIEQSDLNDFATAVNSETDTLVRAVGVLGGYIQQLIAGQAVPLPAADESAIQTALSALGTGVGNLQGLEPPVPAPPADTPPADTPPADA